MRHKVKKIIPEVFTLVLSLIILIPLYMLLLNSFKDYANANKLNLSFSTIELKQIVDNYASVFKESGLFTAYKNSVIVTSVSVILTILCAAMAGFILQRRKQKFISTINFLVIAGMTLPSAIIPTFFILKTIGLAQTYLGVCMVYTAGAFPLAVFLFTGFYNSIPVELDESAIIDGCGSFRLFFQIIFPLVKPVTITVLIITFMGIWNDFIISLFLLNTPKRFTVVLTTFSFYGQKHSEWNLLFADIVLISAPVVALYLILQKYIVSGMVSGAIKG